MRPSISCSSALRYQADQPRSRHGRAGSRSIRTRVRATARLSHWNTIEIYDYGRTDDGTFYYVMELLRGMSLESLVRRYGPLPPERAVHLLRQVCCALREAHATGLTHRDIKPANIFAAERGGVCDVAKLLALRPGETQANGWRDADRPVGLVQRFSAYMAPEQATNYEGVDARSDIYAVGAVAYFLVTGQPPFQRGNIPDVLRAHALEAVTPPSQVHPGIAADLAGVILAAWRNGQPIASPMQEVSNDLSACATPTHGRTTGGRVVAGIDRPLGKSRGGTNARHHCGSQNDYLRAGSRLILTALRSDQVLLEFAFQSVEYAVVPPR